MSYSIEQHVQMIKLYYQNGSSLVATIRALRPFYGRRSGPSKSTLQRLVAKFETTGSVNNQPTPVRQRNARSAENIAAVRESVQENPGQSIPRRAQKLGLSQTSTWRILHRDLATTFETVAAAEVQMNGIKTSSSGKRAAPKALPAAEATKENYVDQIKVEVAPPAAKKASKSKAAKKEETQEQEDSEVELVE